MTTKWNRRTVISTAIAAAVPVFAANAIAQDKQEKSTASVKGKLTDQSLGTLLEAMSLDAVAQEQRYDFSFKATIEDAEWELSMSCVLSQDASSIWVMAWLDELPKSAADVPRTALLRLLSDNDKLGKGKFFTYIAANRRFVLQRVIPNENITSEKFRAVLDDLGQSVVATHPHWSVSNWSSPVPDEAAPASKSTAPVKGSTQTPSGSAASTLPKTTPVKAEKTAVNDSKFNSSVKK